MAMAGITATVVGSYRPGFISGPGVAWNESEFFGSMEQCFSEVFVGKYSLGIELSVEVVTFKRNLFIRKYLISPFGISGSVAWCQEFWRLWSVRPLLLGVHFLPGFFQKR